MYCVIRNVSCVMCNMSHVTYHMSHFACHMSHVTSHMSLTLTARAINPANSPTMHSRLVCKHQKVKHSAGQFKTISELKLKILRRLFCYNFFLRNHNVNGKFHIIFLLFFLMLEILQLVDITTYKLNLSWDRFITNPGYRRHWTSWCVRLEVPIANIHIYIFLMYMSHVMCHVSHVGPHYAVQAGSKRPSKKLRTPKNLKLFVE